MPPARRVVVDFGPAPPGYVPGAGRGAVGFTTRTDIGPARAPRGPPGAPDGDSASAAARALEGAEAAQLNEANYDKFSGYGGALFAATGVTEADMDAEVKYEKVQQHIDGRRRRHRERAAQKEWREQSQKAPTVDELFLDEKKELEKVSADEWLALPEAGDRTGANKEYRRELERQREKFTPITDSLIRMQMTQLAGSRVASIDANTKTPEEKTHGTESSIHIAAGTATDLSVLGAARNRAMQSKLDRLNQRIGGTTSTVAVDEYMKNLDSLNVLTDATQVQNVDKARKLFRSAMKANPTDAQNWINAARLEESAGKITKAQTLLLEACEKLPRNADVWIEAARMHPPAQARQILSRGVRHCKRSVDIWREAAALETKQDNKKRVLRRALLAIPASLVLWKEAVSLEDADDARLLLRRAVECVPEAAELWLALARVENYQEAQKVLNRARQAIPSDPKIWLAAAQLQETHFVGLAAETEGDAAEKAKLRASQLPEKILLRAQQSLKAHEVVVHREQWLEMASHSERGGFPLTAAAVVKVFLSHGVDPRERFVVWRRDATVAEQNGDIEVARAVHSVILTHFGRPTKYAPPAVVQAASRAWWDAAQLERRHGSLESLTALLRRAVTAVPGDERMWLLWAKELKAHGKVDAARDVLEEAYTTATAAAESSERDPLPLFFATAKLEMDDEEYTRARLVMQKAREACGKTQPRVWQRSAQLERQLGDNEAESELLRQAVALHPTAPKLWLMLLQNMERRGTSEPEMRRTFARALLLCPQSAPMWVHYANSCQRHAEARSVLEQARGKCPRDVSVWLASLRLEKKRGETGAKAHEQLLARALQILPKSGELWAYAIDQAPVTKQKARCADALAACKDDAHVMAAAARCFWRKRKLLNTVEWYKRVVAASPENGQYWAEFLALARAHPKLVGGPDGVRQLEERAVAAEPRYGERWIKVAKQVGNERLSTREILNRVVDEFHIDQV